MYKFGQRSKMVLLDAHPNLQAIANEAIKYYDFSVVCSHRNKADQDKAYATGHSKLKFPESKHNKLPSLAIDCYPYSKHYGTLLDTPTVMEHIAGKYNLKLSDPRIKAFIYQEFCRMAQTILVVAQQMNIELVWGADWDMDGDRLEHSFIDLPHFELSGPKYES